MVKHELVEMKMYKTHNILVFTINFLLYDNRYKIDMIILISKPNWLYFMLESCGL